MKPLHILHITFNMNIGGTEQVIRNLVEGLDPERFKSSVVCIDGAIGPWGQDLQARGFKHYCLQRRPGLDFKLIGKLRRLLKSTGAEIVHCHQYTPYSYGFFSSLFTGIPIIFTEHGRFYPDFGTRKRQLINPVMQLGTAATTAISLATKNALIRFENLKGNKIDVIYNGIADLAGKPTQDEQQNLRRSLNLKPDNIVFGTISRLDPIKNQTMMLRAFAQALSLQPNLKLLIVGDGPEWKNLQQLTSTLRLNESVIFTGFQPNPQTYLSLMDVFLLPSLSEGTSMTLLEAMSFSKPAIATAVGGTPEILEHRKTGVLITNENEAGLVNAITTLAQDSNLRSTYGHNARLRYTERFTLEAMVQAYQILYQQVYR